MKKREPGAILCGSNVPMPEGIKPPKGMDVRINVETEGMEEAREEIEMLAEAYDGFPAQVTIRGCRNCTINVYPTQIQNKRGKKKK